MNVGSITLNIKDSKTVALSTINVGVASMR